MAFCLVVVRCVEAVVVDAGELWRVLELGIRGRGSFVLVARAFGLDGLDGPFGVRRYVPEDALQRRGQEAVI
jgi:hypothetical protein